MSYPVTRHDAYKLDARLACHSAFTALLRLIPLTAFRRRRSAPMSLWQHATAPSPGATIGRFDGVAENLLNKEAAEQYQVLRCCEIMRRK